MAASARTLLRRGRWDDARRSLQVARGLLPGLTEALPWLGVQTRLELAAAYVMLRDSDQARLMLGEVEGLLGTRKALGILEARRAALETEVVAMAGGTERRTVRLTPAELRLLPLLATHLSFREIGAHFHLSRHTVKTQAISAYRKLGASSRSGAVQRAEELGLLEAVGDSA
jgi:LuxR family maltose regulon positive regulatory protein